MVIADVRSRNHMSKNGSVLSFCRTVQRTLPARLLVDIAKSLF